MLIYIVLIRPCGVHMRCTAFLSLFIAAALAVPVGALSQPLEGDASSGRQVAIEACSACHHIDADISSKGAFPPSFEDIAKLPSTTELSLRAFLRSSHVTMPNLLIFAPDIDDLIVYILSLKPQSGSSRP